MQLNVVIFNVLFPQFIFNEIKSVWSACVLFYICMSLAIVFSVLLFTVFVNVSFDR